MVRKLKIALIGLALTGLSAGGAIAGGYSHGAAAYSKQANDCRAAYHAQLRTIGSDTTGIYGPGLQRQIIEQEYVRCVDRIIYARNRCPVGTFVHGSGYCIRRPIW